MLPSLWNPGNIISYIIVLAAHREVFETEGKCSCLSSDWVKPLESSISKINFCFFFIVLSSELFHSCS